MIIAVAYAPTMADTAEIVESALTAAELDWESPQPGTYVVQLPGTRKLSTTCSLKVGRHSLSVNAFVIRHPDENEAGVHRWLLERNLKLYGMAYAVDRLGDIYLTARLPLSVVTPRSWTGCSARCWRPRTARSTRCWSWASRARSGASTSGGSRAASRPSTSTRSST